MTSKALYIHYIVKVFFRFISKWYFLLAYYFFVSCIKQIIKYRKNTLINYTFKNNISILFPNNHLTLLVISEIFCFDLFSKLSGCECLLDIWWYIWESAVYLATQNNNVIVYESDLSAYKLLQKNISLHKNITWYNKFVNIDWRDMYVSKWEEIDCWAKWSSEVTWVLTSGISINEILTINHIDGIKIDIEWWEYEILTYMVDNELFNFKKWFIEFHFYEDESDTKRYLDEFCNIISEKWYMYELYDNNYNMIDSKVIHKNTTFLCNMYFELWK